MLKQVLANAFIIPRIKAFITDIFMIYTPILYIMTYFILDGAKSFQNNQSAIFLCFILYGVIMASFLSAKMQTPGFKYAQIKLTNYQGKKIGFFHAFLRFVIWSLSMTFIIGFFFPFFNKKNECLHDYICKTKISFQK